MPRSSTSPEVTDRPRRAEVETVSLRLPRALMDAIRAHCAKHAESGKVLGMQPPTISSVLRQLVEERFGGGEGDHDR